MERERWSRSPHVADLHFKGRATRVSVENFEVGFSLPILVWPHPGKMSLPLFPRSDNAGSRDSKEKYYFA